MNRSPSSGEGKAKDGAGDGRAKRALSGKVTKHLLWPGFAMSTTQSMFPGWRALDLILAICPNTCAFVTESARIKSYYSERR